MGALRGGFLDTPHSLAEARVIFELGEGELEVADLKRGLDMDGGHLSRLLARLERSGLVVRRRSPEDARRQLADLTAEGRRTRDTLDSRAADNARELLQPLSPADRRRLTASMSAIHALLDEERSPRARLRAPRPGDLGWIVEANARGYAEQYGWNVEFEGLVAQIVADYVAGHDPAREATFIAEIDGQRAGSVMCVRGEDERTAKLRMLYVEGWARGQGLGGRLVDRCMKFAREAGYERMELWTNSPLTAARRVYDSRGFEQVDEWEHTSFGHDMLGHTLARSL